MGRTSQTFLILAAAAALAATAAAPAGAQPGLEQARKRLAQADAYFKAGTYDKAIEEYQAAYELVPSPGLLFNIGLCHEHLGNAAEAIDHYERYIAAEPDGAKVPEARARAEALARKRNADLAEADRARRAADEREAGARAFAAGDFDEAVARLSASYDLSPVPEVLFELAEAYRARGDDILAATEYRRYLAASPTGPNRRQANQRLREVEEGGAKAAPDLGAGPTDQPAGRGSLIPAYAAFAAAGVAATVGVVFGLRSLSDLDDIDDHLTVGQPPLDSRDPRLDDGRRAARNADISFAIAGAAAITGVALTWWALRTRSRQAGGDAVVVPAAGPDAAGVRVEVSW